MSQRKLRVKKIFRFEAAHQIPGHSGKCARPHGHSYVLEVEMEMVAPSSPFRAVSCDQAMLMDFKDLKRVVNEIVVDKLDHQDLNRLDLGPSYPREMTTAENLALWIFGVLERALSEMCQQGPSASYARLRSVRLWETATCYAEVVDE